jgi:hypothetical protein
MQTNQANAYTGIQQASFPVVLQMRSPEEILHRDIILNDERLQDARMVIADVVLADNPIPGESFQMPWSRASAQFVEVLESRPANGDWSGPTWKGLKPTWFRCLCEKETKPA